MRYLLLLVLAALLGCGSQGQQDLREPGAEGPIQFTVWDLEQNTQTHIEASEIDLTGPALDEVLLHNARLRVPLKNGWLHMSTREAFLDHGQLEQRLEIDELIELQGEVDGKPLKGTAQGMIIEPQQKSCALRDARFQWGSQLVTVELLNVSSGSELSGKNWQSKPLNADANEPLGD